MTDFTAINETGIFNRLAILALERHDPLPLRKFFSDNPSSMLTSPLEHELIDAITELHHAKHPDDIPEQAIVFSFEYIPWADDDGEHDDILTTTLIGVVDQDHGLALINHIVTTGAPMTAADRANAADLGTWVLTTQVTHGIIGTVLGAAGVILTQLAVFTF